MRARKKTIFCGGSLVGKSTRMKMIMKYYQEKNERIIIHDPSRQEQYFEYAEINASQLAGMKHGTYRIHDIDVKEFFHIISKNWGATKEKGGCVINEDASHFLTAQKNQEVYSLLIGLRHVNVDWFGVTHSIADTPKYIIRQLNEFVFFKTGESWDDIADRFPEEIREIAKQKFIEVNQHEKKWFCRAVTIQKAGTKIFI